MRDNSYLHCYLIFLFFSIIFLSSFVYLICPISFLFPSFHHFVLPSVIHSLFPFFVFPLLYFSASYSFPLLIFIFFHYFLYYNVLSPFVFVFFILHYLIFLRFPLLLLSFPIIAYRSLLFALQDRSSKGRTREIDTRTIKKDIISSELNEDGDARANGERVKSRDRNRRGEKDESLKRSAPDWPATWTISYAGANEAAIGVGRGYRRERHQLLCSNYTSR